MSGGHDKGSRKAIREIWRFGSGMVNMSRLYGAAGGMTPYISPGWAPALQIAQVPLRPAPCDTLAVLGCLQLGCAGSRQSSRQVIVNRHYPF